MVGGAAVTEEFHPGFRNSVAAYTVEPAQPEGHRRSEPAPITACASSNAAPRISCPLPMARYLLTGEGRTQQSGRKAQRARRRRRSTPSRASSKPSPTCCAQFVLRAPPNIGRGLWRSAPIREAFNALGSANLLRETVAGAAAHAARSVHALGRRDAGRALRERPGQGAVRLRRHRRQLRQPHARRARPM